MGEELELISDGEGIAVIGDPELVGRFLDAQSLPSRELDLGRLTANLGTGAAAAQAATNAYAQSGRWVKLTSESAAKMKQFKLTPTDTKGVSHAMVGPRGSIKSWLQIDTSAAAQLTNPAFLSGAAGIMTQVAMQQAMNEIGDYLERIDRKLDDVLRAQRDAAIAPMIGTGFLLEEAMALREAKGRVDEVTWSKLHNAPAAIHQTQAYALSQLDALTEKLERTADLGDLADATRKVHTQIDEWLAVLARSVQLQDAIAVIELDRVLDASPAEIDAHRDGLRIAREQRLTRLSTSTARILSRIEAASGTANAKVLLHPAKAPGIVRACGDASTAVSRFDELLRIERAPLDLAARRWSDAARDTGDKALSAGADGVDAAKRLGEGAAELTKSAGARGRVVGAKAGALGQAAGAKAGERARKLGLRGARDEEEHG